MWLHTPVLHSASSIHDNLPLAQKAVDLAKETIRYLTRLNNSTNLYRRIQVFYHQFLTSAIAVLFLASTHAPLRFSAGCRAEFYLALELVKDMSSKSWVSQRLWRTVRSLRDYAPRLGLQEDDPHSDAAAAMAGLASGGPPPSSSSYGPPPPRPPPEAPSNGAQLQSEMTKIFEGYMGINGFPLPLEYLEGRALPPPPANPGYANGMPGQGDGQGQGPAYGREGGVYERFKDMF